MLELKKMSEKHFLRNRNIEKILNKRGLFSNTSAPWQQDILHEEISAIFKDKKIKILDAACGIGNNFETLMNFSGELFAFDISIDAVNLAKELYQPIYNDKIRISNASLFDSRLPSNSFDLVVCTEALEHVKDIKGVFDELNRVLKSDGYIILSFQNHFNPSSLFKFVYEIIFKKNWDAWGTHRHKEGYESYLTSFKVLKVLKDNNFKIVKKFGADYLNAWFLWVPFLYKNYSILDRYPIKFLGKIPFIKNLGMDYFIVLKRK